MGGGKLRPVSFISCVLLKRNEQEWHLFNSDHEDLWQCTTMCVVSPYIVLL